MTDPVSRYGVGVAKSVLSDAPPPKPHPRQAPDSAAALQTEDEELRRQCLVWAFQTREFCDVPHMQVVEVAQGYYDFIKGQRQACLDDMRGRR